MTLRFSLNVWSGTPISIVGCTVAYRARSGMYAIIMMMTTNQNAALSVAQAQPPASSRPKKARRRTIVVPGPSACDAIVPPYFAVRVPVMLGWTVQTKP